MFAAQQTGSDPAYAHFPNSAMSPAPSIIHPSANTIFRVLPPIISLLNMNSCAINYEKVNYQDSNVTHT